MRAVSLYGIYNAFDMYIIRCLVDVFQERDVNEEFIPQWIGCERLLPAHRLPLVCLSIFMIAICSPSLSLLRNSRLHPSPATLLSAPKVCDAIIAAFLVSRLLFKSSFRLLRTLRRRRGRKKKKKKGRGVVDKREEGADATVRQSQSRWDDKQYLLLVSLFAYACSPFLFLFLFLIIVLFHH